MKSELIVGMTLEEALSHIDGNIKIGCKGGSGFIHCGDVPDMKQIEDLDADYLERADASIINARASVITIVNKFYKELSNLYQAFQKNLTKQFNSISRKETRLKKRKHFKLREVLDVYNSIDEPNTLIILIDGYEEGDYWTTDEAKGETNVK